MGKVLDLDVFVPEERSLKLGGKVFDLTNIPFEVSIQVYNIEEAINKISTTNRVDPESYEKIFAIIFKVLKSSDPEIDEPWLRKQITVKIFSELMPFIFSALFDDGKKNDEEIKDEAPTLSLVE